MGNNTKLKAMLDEHEARTVIQNFCLGVEEYVMEEPEGNTFKFYPQEWVFINGDAWCLSAGSIHVHFGRQHEVYTDMTHATWVPEFDSRFVRRSNFWEHELEVVKRREKYIVKEYINVRDNDVHLASFLRDSGFDYEEVK